VWLATTVRAALRSDCAAALTSVRDRDRRGRLSSRPFSPVVGGDGRTCQATVIAEEDPAGHGGSRFSVNGWSNCDRAYQVPEAFGRTEYKPVELGQWDCGFPEYAIPVGHGQTAVLPVLARGALLLALDPGPHDRFQRVGRRSRWPSCGS